METNAEFWSKVYADILENKHRIEKDLNGTAASFHNGYNHILIDKGYADVCGTDSISTFSCAGNVIRWSVCEWNGWKVSNAITIGKCKLRIDTLQNFVADATSARLTEADLCRKPYTKPNYTKFIVRDTGAEYWSNGKIGEFDNLSDALQCAHNVARERCNNGRLTDLRNNYHCTPRDTTRYHKPYLLYLEYYNYCEHEYGIAICGLETK